MNITKTIFAAGAIALLPFAASATVLSANQGLMSDGVTAVPLGRSDIDSVTDGVASTFFSLGIHGTLTADVSPLGVASGSVVEVTFGNNIAFPESAQVWLGDAGNMFKTLLGELFNEASGASSTGAGISSVPDLVNGFTTFLIDVGSNVGTMLTLKDTTLINFEAAYCTSVAACEVVGTINSDGFDVSGFTVTPVPVPAAGLLLLGGLGGLAAMKRRKKA